MEKPRYIIRVVDGALFGWCADWLKIPGMVEYDVNVHGYRAEVAAAMGLVAPAPTVAPAPAVVVSEYVAGQTIIPSPVATEPVKVQEQQPESEFSDLFAPR